MGKRSARGLTGSGETETAMARDINPRNVHARRVGRRGLVEHLRFPNDAGTLRES
jgi:hypothetical protein